MSLNAMNRCKDWSKCKNVVPYTFSNSNDTCSQCVRSHDNVKAVPPLNLKDNFKALRKMMV